MNHLIDLTAPNATLKMLEQLIRLPSLTPQDKGCQLLLADYLSSLDFHIEHLRFDEVDNLWAKKGKEAPLFVFAGHTDVVPPGPLTDWTSPPFEPTIRDGFLYGRGAVDMKGGLAAMLTGCAQFLKKYPHHKGSIAFLITSDEEGIALNGTKKVVEYLSQKGEVLNWCVVGEPSSQKQVGDMVKIGRRGSLGGMLTIYGKQGHIAYPHLADNPIHRSLAILSTLCEIRWDEGNAQFSPTSFQLSNIRSGTGATNVIPGALEVDFNFRYSPEVTAEILKERVVEILENTGVRYALKWGTIGQPFFMKSPFFSHQVADVIHELGGLQPELSTSGGTSDGRFIATMDCEVVELGLCNATIHQVNECVRISDLEQLSHMYAGILTKMLNSSV